MCSKNGVNIPVPPEPADEITIGPVITGISF